MKKNKKAFYCEQHQCDFTGFQFDLYCPRCVKDEEIKVKSTASEVYESKYLFGLYSDPKTRINRFRSVNDLIGQDFRDMTARNNLVPPGRLYHAISLEGIFHTESIKAAGKVKIKGARRPISLTFHDWDAARRQWVADVHSRITLV